MSSLEYLAGFFDGEACIRGALQPSGAVVISVNISLKNSIPLRLLQDKFGVGTIALYPQFPPYKYYTFTAYSHNAKVVLTELLPFLIVKKQEAELALEALSIQQDRTKSLSEVDRERLAKICHLLKHLKRELPVDQEILRPELASVI